MIKNYIFDLDGTIADTLPLCITAFKSTIKKLTGFEPNDDDVCKYFGKTEEGIIKELYKGDLQEGIEEYKNTYKRLHYLCPKIFDGIEEIFEEIRKQNCTISLVTGKGPQTCEVSLEYYGISDIFTRIKTGSPVENVKAIKIEEIISELRLKKTETVYIGDTADDIIECRKVGIQIYSALWGSRVNKKAVEKEKPDKIFYNTNELLDLLKFLHK